MSREASGTQSSDVSAILDAPKRPVDLRFAWDRLREGVAFSDTGNDGGGGDDGDDDDGDGDGDDGTGGAEGANGANNDSKVKDPEKKRLSDEAAAARVKARDTQKTLDETLARLKEFEDKDKTETDLLKAAKEELETKVSSLSDTVQKQAVRLAFFESGAAALFRNPATALRLIDLKDIEIDDEGEADAKAIKEAADALLKAEPYLAAGGEDGEDDDDGSDANNGAPSGRQTNGKRKSKDDLNQEALAKKYPALRR